MRKWYQDIDSFVRTSSYGIITPEQIAKYKRSKELYAYMSTVLKKVKRVIYNSTDPAILELTDEMKLDLVVKETSICITKHWDESNKDFDLDESLNAIERLIRFFHACDNQ